MVHTMKRFVTVLILLLLMSAAVGKFFLFDVPRVVGNDMAPALQSGDLLLAYRLDTTPARGDLILFHHPQVTSRLVIRRVVALPGEQIAVRNEVPLINGKPAARTIQRELNLSDEGTVVHMKQVQEQVGEAPPWLVLKDPARRSRDTSVQTLGPGQYFVMADNRNHGTDSRTFGPVSGDTIRATVVCRISAGPGSIEGQGQRPGYSPLR